jgi:2-methylisocitrate lyase-like PEP mutase family enzyme
MTSIEERRTRFAELHESGCFVIPNPWDVGSARILEALGFAALATTSAGLQFSRGEPDSVTGLGAEATLRHVGDLVGATDLPVNADFQSGYADDLPGLMNNVRACVASGVAGFSIEDATGSRSAPLYDVEAATERIAATRAAIDETGERVLLTARAESFLVGHDSPLDEAVRRLRRYAGAGADVLYAPGLTTREEIAEVVAAVAPKPVNVLVGRDIGMTVAELGALGVRRVSLGSALARTAWGAFLRAAKPLVREGRFDGLEGAAPFAELNHLFSTR